MTTPCVGDIDGDGASDLVFAGQNGAIYAFWDDLTVNPDFGDRVLTELVGAAPNREFVIPWRNVRLDYRWDAVADFEIVLHENGQIRMQYRGIDNDYNEKGGDATIGLEDENGAIAFAYSFNEPVLSDGLAIRYMLPPFGFVEGTVTDRSDGTPISGATVTAQGSGRSTTSDANGFYRLRLVPPWLHGQPELAERAGGI